MEESRNYGKRVGEPFDGNLDAHVKDHIFKSCMRWIDPYGDGSCRDGIDGMRLDVAEDVPVGFGENSGSL